MKAELVSLSKNWSDHNRLQLDSAFQDIDQLFIYYEEVMMGIPDFDSYDLSLNPELLFISGSLWAQMG